MVTNTINPKTKLWDIADKDSPILRQAKVLANRKILRTLKKRR